MKKNDTIEQVGKGAAVLSVMEVGLGSLLHAFHVPTSGHWLSLNQSFWLSRLTFELRTETDARFAAMTLSNVTASMKSLSPAGKKLTPMLAISVQGALFNIGVLLLGQNVVGAALGAILSSVWAFVQPVAIYYVIFGNTLFDAGAKLFEKVHEMFHVSRGQAVAAAIAVIIIKALFSIVVVLLARVSSHERVGKYQERLLDTARRSCRSGTRVERSNAMNALKDLFHPLFVMSFVLTIVFFFWVESSRAELIWALVRPVAVGFTLFFFFRIVPMEKLLALIEKLGFFRFSRAFRVARAAIMRERQ